MTLLNAPDYTELVTQAEYARRRGCARQTVLDRVNARQIAAFGPKKLICPALADIQWAANVRARASSSPSRPDLRLTGSKAAPSPLSASGAATGEGGETASGDLGYQAARARREIAAAERAELETALAAGRTLDRESALRGVFDTFRSLRDRAFQVAHTCSPTLVGLTDAREIEGRIDAALRRAFADFRDPIAGTSGDEIR